MGGSYGGYATLAGVAFTPDVYAAGVSHRRAVEPHHAPRVDPALLGGGPHHLPRAHGQPERRPRARRSSSASRRSTRPQKIKTPLLVVQGANDPRVKKAESDQIVIALRDRGFPVEYIVRARRGARLRAPRQQHGRCSPPPRRSSAKHLGGRFQEGGTPEVVGPPEGDHGRPEDGRPREEGRRRRRRRRRSRHRTLQPGRRPTPERSPWAARRCDLALTRVVREEARPGSSPSAVEDADGRGGRHDQPREGDARLREADRSSRGR